MSRLRQFVTGAAGFIGSHYCEVAAQSHDVRGVDNFDDYYAPEIKLKNCGAVRAAGAVVTEMDIRHSVAICEEMCRVRPDVIVHLAARPGVRGSIASPHMYFDVNVLGTINVLEAARCAKVPHVVLASSSSVYGERGVQAFSEEDTVADRPVSPYAASKRAMEMAGHAYHALYGMDVTCLRFFTVYGPRQRPEMAITRFVSAALRDEVLDVFGDGTSSRDYTYVSDIVAGINAAVERRPEGFQVFNLGGRQPVDLNTLIAQIGVLSGHAYPLQRHVHPRQPGDVSATWADCTKAAHLLGWVPKISLEEGLRCTIQWARLERGSHAAS